MKLWITSKMTRIFRIDTGSCNCYLLEKNGHFVLVDTGIVTDRNKVLHALAHREAVKLDAIFITHVHSDHAGNAAYLSRRYHCKVYAPKTELQSLMDGRCKVAEGMNVFARLLNLIMYHMDLCTKFEGVNNASAYPEEDEVRVTKIGSQEDWDITIMKTPGNTQGSVSILVDGEVALVGDTMSHGLVGSIYPTFAEKEEEILPSWRKLLLKKCKLYFPSHGRVIKHRLLAESYSVYKQNKGKLG